MLQTPWSIQKIKQYKKETGQDMLMDEHVLASYSTDFGKLIKSPPSALCIPDSLAELQQFLNYSHQHSLAVALRGKGLSQSGQSLAAPGGLTLDMKNFQQIYELEHDSIWVDGNATWSALIEKSLKKSLIPYVQPYNINLSIGGVLSVGGIGASSFKYGSIVSQVKALEVIKADGQQLEINSKSPLFHACLGGQGRFGVITKACINLRPCHQKIRSFFLVYLDFKPWLEDLTQLKNIDYIEAFCSSAVQGTKLVEGVRVPFAQWLYVLHLSVEYEQTPPVLEVIAPHLKAWKLLHCQDETLQSYLHRHDSRFEAMKLLGQWELPHPWYECFISGKFLAANLESILAQLPLSYSPIIHIAPVANSKQNGFLMLPKAHDCCSLMILNPGVNPALVPQCLQAIQYLDKLFLSAEGKRYLSGYLGKNIPAQYWKDHFGTYYNDWISLKKSYDPHHVFKSYLHRL